MTGLEYGLFDCDTHCHETGGKLTERWSPAAPVSRGLARSEASSAAASRSVSGVTPVATSPKSSLGVSPRTCRFHLEQNVRQLVLDRLE